jgi:ABC-2 type transport system permease protein
MRAIFLIASRDLTSLFRGTLGFVMIAGLLAAQGLVFQGVALSGGEYRSSEVLEYFFRVAFGFTAAAGVLIAMRSIALELRESTIVTLYTAPISEWQIVLGKWLSSLAFVLLFLLLGGFMPYLISVHGTINPGHLLSGYLGLVLVACTATAIGTFSSALSEHQVLGGVIGGLLLGGLVVLWWVSSKTEAPFSGILAYMAMYQKHFEDFGRGVIQSRSVIYYCSLSFLALLGARVILGARRWR